MLEGSSHHWYWFDNIVDHNRIVLTGVCLDFIIPFSALGLHVGCIMNHIIVTNHCVYICLQVVKLMLSADCDMSGLVDAWEKYDTPPVFHTSIFQFGSEWTVIMNSEFPQSITILLSQYLLDSSLGIVIPSVNKSWVAKLMSNNKAMTCLSPWPRITVTWLS